MNDVTLPVQMSTELKPEPPTGLWRRIAQALLNDATIDAIFTHVRNLVVATLVLAAGIHATRADSVRSIPGVLDVGVAGYVVAVIGGGLILLNLANGLYKLSKTQWPVLLQVLLIVAYLLGSIRVARLLLAFRTGWPE